MVRDADVDAIVVDDGGQVANFLMEFDRATAGRAGQLPDGGTFSDHRAPTAVADAVRPVGTQRFTLPSATRAPVKCCPPPYVVRSLTSVAAVVDFTKLTAC
jgi:hypothetical protein